MPKRKTMNVSLTPELDEVTSQEERMRLSPCCKSHAPFRN
jgi:hypothetical protein